MTQFTLDAIANKKLRNAVDWTVFTLGAASLTIAIAATALTSNSDLATNVTDAPTQIVQAG